MERKEVDFSNKIQDENTQGVENFRDTSNKLDEVLALENMHADVIYALSTIYTTSFRADLDTHSYDVLNSVNLMEGVAGKHGNFDDVEEDILEAFVSSQMRDKMRIFLNLDTLPDRLKNVNTIVTEYLDPEGRWFQARFIVKNRDEQGKVHEVLYVARDITKEKQYKIVQQEKIRLQLQVINALGNEYSTLYLIDCSTKQWSIFKSSANSSIKNIIDNVSTYSNYEAAFNAYIDHYVVEEDREYLRKHTAVECLIEETPSVGIHSLSYDRILDGSIQHWQINSAKFQGDDGKTHIVLGFRDVHDIVEKQMKQEVALREALMVARHANRAKTTFLNNMSHDIRTPMNAIIGYTALAETHIENTVQVQDYLKKIHTSSTHLLSLINEILDMSRIESGTVKLEENIVHIPDVLHDLRIMIQGQIASKQQNLYIDTLDVSHEDVITDKLRLNQILLNLVSNAMKYTGIGGDIIIRVQEKPCNISGYTSYEFRVKDTGIGMSPQFIGSVFDSFSRERTATVSGIEGTGLGLSITKSIVDLMNGDISVRSQLGKGSEFIVNVDFKLTDQEDVVDEIPELLGARALVVDDDINTCQSVSKMLRKIEMRPDWSTSGNEAIIRAKEAAEINDEYKVYIIDYLMPDMNGIEVVRRIRRVIGDDIPIIVLTAYDWAELEDEAREAGVTAFVAKPIFMSELRAALVNNKNFADILPKEPQKVYDYKGKRVLLVEDNELNREIATAFLSAAGFIVDEAVDGIEAVNILYQAPEDKYDLVFMDIQMPRMDGYMATREIRTFKNNKKANIPIVAMTANAFEEDRRKAFESGMDGHIAKPIDMDSIARTLDSIFIE